MRTYNLSVLKTYYDTYASGHLEPGKFGEVLNEALQNKTLKPITKKQFDKLPEEIQEFVMTFDLLKEGKSSNRISYGSIVREQHDEVSDFIDVIKAFNGREFVIILPDGKKAKVKFHSYWKTVRVYGDVQADSEVEESEAVEVQSET